MKLKKMTALLCAGAFALSAVGSFPSAAESATIGESEETKLPAPMNVYVDENDVIRWDAVEGAASYHLSLEIPTPDEIEYLSVEPIQFQHLTQNYVANWKSCIPWDNYKRHCLTYPKINLYISVYSIDEQGNYGGQSDLIEYTFTIEESEETKLPAPTNVYVDENEVIRWDAVEGAVSYRAVLTIDLDGALSDYYYRILNSDTNYLDNWRSALTNYDPMYAKNHTLLVSVAAVDASETEGAYSAPIEFTYSMKHWNAEFKYDAETGDLTWENWTDDVSYGNLNYYLWGIPSRPYLPFPPSVIASDEGYWNPAFSGYSIPRINLPLVFAYDSLNYSDIDYRGNHTLWLTSCALGSATEWWTDKVGDYESADSFTYQYDGCDINPALKPPTDNIWQGGWLDSSTIDFSFDPVDGAVGYIVHFTQRGGRESDDYTYSLSNDIQYWSFGDRSGVWKCEICSVDQNGDRSEWSEPFYFETDANDAYAEKNPLNYTFVNNIDSEGNLLLTEATGAVRYTVDVTGNGANLSFESETPVIEGFNNALTSYPAGEYTLTLCTYNDWGICRKYQKSFDKKETGYFNETNETGSPVESAPEAAGIPESDRIPAVGINPAFNLTKKGETDVFFNISNIKIKAKEIYDEAGLKRAEEALGEEIIGNKHYNLLDLTLWEGDTDISNGYDGLVKVIIPLPTGHRDKTFHVYRFVQKGDKWGHEEIPGEQTEDSYIIYLEHFSEYALVADGGEAPDDPGHTHTFPDEWKSDGASHWHECECGEKSGLASHTYGEWTNSGNFRTRTCAVCNYTETASVGGTGNPGYRPPNPPVSADNTDNAAAEPERDDKESGPAGDEEDEPEAEPADTGEDGEDEEDGDEAEDGEEYDDTCSKDEPDSEFDTEGARSEPISAEEANARDENPGTGAPVNGLMLLASLAAGAAALTAGRKKASRR